MENKTYPELVAEGMRKTFFSEEQKNPAFEKTKKVLKNAREISKIMKPLFDKMNSGGKIDEIFAEGGFANKRSPVDLISTVMGNGKGIRVGRDEIEVSCSSVRDKFADRKMFPEMAGPSARAIYKVVDELVAQVCESLGMEPYDGKSRAAFVMYDTMD